MNLNLDTPIRYIPGVGPIMARRLERLNIHTVEDFLFHTPFRYDDFSLLSKISALQEGETATIHATVTEMKNIYTRYRKNLQKAVVSDETGSIEVTWFNQPYLTSVIKKGSYVSLAGKTKRFGNKLTLQSPVYEILQSEFDIRHSQHTGRLVPIYPETANITSKWIRAKIKFLLEKLKSEIPDYLPHYILQKEKFPSLSQALSLIHFPKNENDIKKGKNRLAFDELLLLQLKGQIRKTRWKTQLATKQFDCDKKKIQTLINNLPFTLTKSQEIVISEILSDIGKTVPMNRLLQGDVGSGKTVVAAIASFVAYLNNCTTLIMAPTEILAQQQAKALETLFRKTKVKIALVTGSTKNHKKNADIIIGTHALLHRKLTQKSIGLVIIDEQHRFGVRQRALIQNKKKTTNTIPHVLTMTATPIPRTIALTLYGDLDISTIDEMPKGRKPVKTWVVPPTKRNNAYSWIKKQKAQTFIICPFIEESETLTTVKAVTVEYERLKTEAFSNLNLGLVHGKMKPRQKQDVLENFRNQKIDILVATPVVEVGIDIPTATVMLIEGADRFGLAQLHQLRGRVGRGNKQSYCLLFSSSNNAKTMKRLKMMEKANSGAELVQLDLKLRGPGDIYGISQHGFFDLKHATFANLSQVTRAKHYAQELLQKDASLSQYRLLRKKLKIGTIDHISPN